MKTITAIEFLIFLRLINTSSIAHSWINIEPKHYHVALENSLPVRNLSSLVYKKSSKMVPKMSQRNINYITFGKEMVYICH